MEPERDDRVGEMIRRHLLRARRALAQRATEVRQRDYGHELHISFASPLLQARPRRSETNRPQHA